MTVKPKNISEQNFKASNLSKNHDLASFIFGSSVVAVTNNNFETAFRMIKPDPVKNVSSKDCSLKDGWSVKIKGKDNIEQCIIKLGQAGLVYGFDIDTSYFTAPEKFSVSIEGAHHLTGNIQADDVLWVSLLPRVNLDSCSHNFFELSEQPEVAYTHLRICCYSNGGIARIHAYGKSTYPISPKATIPQTLTAMPLTSEAYAPYGDVIHPPGARSKTGANQGTASKFHHVALVNNLFPQGDGKMNVCIFRCKPAQQLPFTVKLLERHPYSTQAFIPMTSGGTRGYLVVVALNGIDDRPDLSTLKAFIATSTQGVNYRQGVWHHPMIALDSVTDFAVIVHENGIPKDDCNEVNVPHVLVRVPGFQANL
ncbi:hypothetical protein G6F16_002078 [Rhizopus arrhizus]|nr:hypothetical protein G6F23_011050 [Rhizopus arrhizus]KAG0780557.1 hypothetical protein G6F21_012079 [Rhizopus arrhizus]KAG0806541.1 hypothetical protein G6F20_011048 [Rhizopus arrhizus]KAG0825606.1 hypothetical protein G6F19_009737 [Rhizopus arrhizus]KAG0844376.1 hypothetical protein G6F18_001937 [Rhizopus arrhizus]